MQASGATRRGVLAGLAALPAGRGLALPALGPVGPGASPAARELLAYLCRIRGRSILVGQHDYLEAPDQYVQALFAETGRYPALHGYEMGAIMDQPDDTVRAQRAAVVDSARRWHALGGIVAMTYHARYPGLCHCWSSVQRPTSQAEFDAIVTADHPAHAALLRDLDDVAVHLAALAEAGVPVLWRPYHEMNGDWFWWGGKQGFAQLWRTMFDRFQTHHRLDNLIWVWCANAPTSHTTPLAATFPGPGMVDVLALDIYGGAFKQEFYDELQALAAGKPVAIGENGELPQPAILAARQPGWVWQMTWGKMLLDHNSREDRVAFLAQSRAVTLHKLPWARGKD